MLLSGFGRPGQGVMAVRRLAPLSCLAPQAKDRLEACQEVFKRRL